MDSNVLFCIEINLEFVFASHNGDEVVNILLIGIFDTKAIYNECKRDVPKLVYE